MATPPACVTVAEGEKSITSYSRSEIVSASSSENKWKKKFKVNNDFNDEMREKGEIKSYGIDDYDSDDWEHRPDKHVFEKYFQQLHDSDGFDFDQHPGSCMEAPICPISTGRLDRDPELVDELKGYASMAIKKHFPDDGKERKVLGIVKVNAGGCRDWNYYITFKVNNNGNEETFQAQVVISLEGAIEIPVCRPKV